MILSLLLWVLIDKNMKFSFMNFHWLSNDTRRLRISFSNFFSWETRGTGMSHSETLIFRLIYFGSTENPSKRNDQTFILISKKRCLRHIEGTNVGAYRQNSNQGAVYLIYGGAKSSMSNIVLSSTTLNPLITGFMITGNTVNDYFGRSMGTAGDINNDGYDDIIVSVYGKESKQGVA